MAGLAAVVSRSWRRRNKDLTQATFLGSTQCSSIIVRMKAIASLALVLFGLACGSTPRSSDFRVIVLGFDGVDPDLIQEWMADLPNIRKLSQTGTVLSLGTTNPPQSPVVWASFATGLNPGKHGIFDFLRRDPSTYFPDIGFVEVEKPRFLFRSLPIRWARYKSNRRGISFWEHLDQSGFRTTNLRIPVEFPPRPLSHGRTLSGLGVPDVRGTWGTFFYLATDITQWDLGDTEFGGRTIKLEGGDGKFRAELDGPVDPREDGVLRITADMDVELNEESTAVNIRVQGREEIVQEGQWSDWFRFQFQAGPLMKIRGVSRFYVIETFPEIRLYLMPISPDPMAPSVPLSYPEDFAASLVASVGNYKSLGWVHETWGLNEEQIGEQIFLEDLFRNMNSLERMLFETLQQDDVSLVTAVFTATDSVSHMFYRLIDPEHPRYQKDLALGYGNTIRRVYQRMDSVIGRVLEVLGERDILMIVSDHGFHSWSREFNTNSWLLEGGFMALKGGDESGQEIDRGGSFFPNVDWSKTRAYALGLGHIYINLKGREGQGIVEPGEEFRELVGAIRAQILTYRDPETKESVVQNVYLPENIYSGDQIEHAGDLQLSFKSGYRTSWQTSLGAVPSHVLVANMKKWSGDHSASDFSDTSGVFICNRPIKEDHPDILDIAPTLYRLFGVEIPAEVDGHPLTLTQKRSPSGQ